MSPPLCHRYACYDFLHVYYSEPFSGDILCAMRLCVSTMAPQISVCIYSWTRAINHARYDTRPVLITALTISLHFGLDVISRIPIGPT